jgi:hypothetical protein
MHRFARHKRKSPRIKPKIQAPILSHLRDVASRFIGVHRRPSAFIGGQHAFSEASRLRIRRDSQFGSYNGLQAIW